MTVNDENEITLPEGAELQDDGSVVVTLAVPVGDRNTVRLRRPRAGDTRRMEAVKGDVARGFWMISQLAELSPAEVDALDSFDVNVLGEVIAFFGAVRPR